MSSPVLEAFLARLYTDAALREKFLNDPELQALDAGLSNTEAIALRHIDRAGLHMAAASYARKRAYRRCRCHPIKRFFARLRKEFRWITRPNAK